MELNINPPISYIVDYLNFKIFLYDFLLNNFLSFHRLDVNMSDVAILRKFSSSMKNVDYFLPTMKKFYEILIIFSGFNIIMI